MLFVYEFEVLDGERGLLAFPYDFGGGTQGHDFKEVCEMAADWLYTEATIRIDGGVDFPEPTFGNEPRHGGRNIVVAVKVD